MEITSYGEDSREGSRRCINCGGYEDYDACPEAFGCECEGDYRAPWQIARDEEEAEVIESVPCRRCADSA